MSTQLQIEMSPQLQTEPIQPQPDIRRWSPALRISFECRAGAGSVRSEAVGSFRSEAVCSFETSVRKRLEIVFGGPRPRARNPDRGTRSRYGLPRAIPGCIVGENVYSNHGCGSNLNF